VTDTAGRGRTATDVLERGAISPFQLALLTIVTGHIATIIIQPSVLARTAGEGSWVSVILAIIAGFGLALGVARIGHLMGGRSLLAFVTALTGRSIAQVFLVVFTALFLVLPGALVLRELIDFVAIASLPETPVIVLLILALGISILPARGGLEVVARVAELTVPLLVLAEVVVSLLGLGRFQPGLLTPVLGSNPWRLLSGIPFPLAALSQVTVMLVILPQTDRRYLAPALAGGIAGAGLLFLISVVVTVGTLGANQVANLTLPLYTAARYTRVTLVIDRFAELAILFWTAGAFVKLSLFLYLAAYNVTTCLCLGPDYRRLLWPLALIMLVVAALLFPNPLRLQDFLSRTLLWVVLGFSGGLVVLLLLLAWWRGRKPERGCAGPAVRGPAGGGRE